jgi:hypothetical protein
MVLVLLPGEIQRSRLRDGNLPVQHLVPAQARSLDFFRGGVVAALVQDRLGDFALAVGKTYQAMVSPF